MKKMKTVMGLAAGVTLFGALLAGCDTEEGKKSSADPKVAVDAKNTDTGKVKAKKEKESVKTFENPLFTTTFDGGKYSLVFEGPKTGDDVANFRLTYENTLDKDITFKYAGNKRVSFVLVDGEGDVVAEKSLTVKGDFSSSEKVAEGSTFAYPIPVEDVPNGIYTLHLTHYGKSDDVKTDMMILPGIEFTDKEVTVTEVSTADTKPAKVTKERPKEEPKKEVEKKADAKTEASSEKKADVVKPEAKKDPKPKSESEKKQDSAKVEEKKEDPKKDTAEKVPAIKADVTFNGWADSHSVEVMLGDTPAVFQVSEKAVPAIDKLEPGAKVSFVFTQNGVTRTVLSVMK